MGAAPSRETHRRGLFIVPQCAHSKKQDIVMIPLTKEFFPSPNCPLFVQFHKARCSAAVNYYFRRPGNPGDLSRIPNYADAFREEGEEKGGGEKELDGKAPPSPTSPEVGHDLTSSEETEKGAEQATADEDQFIDTAGDWEAAKVGEDSYPSREALYRGVIESIEETLFDTDQEMREAYARERARGCETYGTYSAKQRRVLPVMCAVAFRHEISKTATPGESSPSMSTPAHPAFGAGIVMGNCTVNIVGCFGFVSVQDEVEAAHQEGLSTHLGTPLGSSVPIPPPQPGSCVSSELSNYAPATPLQSIMQVGGQSLLSYPGGMAADGGAKGLLMTLPASAAAPLAAMVFLTKSAGEQKLSHVTFVAASTYYFQMIQAGVISRRPNFPLSGAAAFGTYYGGMSPPTGDGPPPLPYPPAPPPLSPPRLAAARSPILPPPPTCPRWPPSASPASSRISRCFRFCTK
ncbi:unnamed protein product [Phytomonas sp. EM1]|nr:unnamed protein product [Phytomonas sp. EM1]|eukprot:CCW65622.1 unnamed protein product [Phytomonas sp. isolate EM1]